MLEFADVATADGTGSGEETGLSGSWRAVEDEDADGREDVPRTRTEEKWIMKLANNETNRDCNHPVSTYTIINTPILIVKDFRRAM